MSIKSALKDLGLTMTGEACEGNNTLWGLFFPKSRE